MSLPFFLAIGTTLLFGCVAIYFSRREELLRRQLKSREELQKRRLYEISTLRAIQERIGYSLDIERVIDTITGSLKNLFPYATASSLLIEPNKVVFKTAIEEAISHAFIDEVKKSMVASLSTLIGKPLPEYIEEIRTGRLPDDNNKHILASFFHIPLVVNGQIVGLINVSSTQPGLYKEEDMTILYQMTTIASNALSKLQDVIHTEETRLLAMIGSLSDGLISLDVDMHLTLINPAAKKLLTVTEKDMLTFTDILPVLQQCCDITTLIQQTVTTKKLQLQENIHLGNTILRLVITPVLQIADGKESVIGTTIILHDMTLEESLNTLKEDFTNGIVHELRAPLTAIKSGTELLLSDKSITASQEKLMTIIDEQAKRMLFDINSLLDAAKMDAGKFTIEKHAEDIGKVIQEVIELYTPEADEKHLVLSSTVEQNLPHVAIDRQRISEVLQNLLSNSLKFTPGGGTIHVSATLSFHEHLPKSATNPGVVVAIADTGSGIPKDKQGYLFSKFTHVDNSPVPHVQTSTGLGLYISKGIVTAHDGQIYLSSEEGKGTTVSFTVPLAESKPTVKTFDQPTTTPGV